jgi:hypothetical protein
MGGRPGDRPTPRPPVALVAVVVPQSTNAVEFDAVIAASGVLNVLPRVQRIKMGSALGGQLAHVWADEHSVHVLIDGTSVRTLPSNLSAADLDELRLRGAQPAGPPPASPAPARTGQLGTAQLAGHTLNVGTPLAGRRVTLRLDGHLVHVIADGVLAKTLSSPIRSDERTTLRGARLAPAALPAPSGAPISVRRRVPTEGVVMVTRQRLRIGRHPRRQDRHHPRRGHPLPRPARRPATQPAPAHHQPARHPVQGLRRTRHNLTTTTMSREQTVNDLPRPHTTRPGAHLLAAQTDHRVDRPKDPHPRRPRTAGPGRRSPRTSNYGWPNHWQPTSADHGTPRPARPAHPARVRRSFRNIRSTTVLPANAPKPTHPGLGRPAGSHNQPPAPTRGVGKTVERDRTLTARQHHAG